MAAYEIRRTPPEWVGCLPRTCDFRDGEIVDEVGVLVGNDESSSWNAFQRVTTPNEETSIETSVYLKGAGRTGSSLSLPPAILSALAHEAVFSGLLVHQSADYRTVMSTLKGRETSKEEAQRPVTGAVTNYPSTPESE